MNGLRLYSTAALEDRHGEDDEREQDAVASLAEERGISVEAARDLLAELRADAELDLALAYLEDY